MQEVIVIIIFEIRVKRLLVFFFLGSAQESILGLGLDTKSQAQVSIKTSSNYNSDMKRGASIRNPKSIPDLKNTYQYHGRHRHRKVRIEERVVMPAGNGS